MRRSRLFPAAVALLIGLFVSSTAQDVPTTVVGDIAAVAKARHLLPDTVSLSSPQQVELKQGGKVIGKGTWAVGTMCELIAVEGNKLLLKVGGLSAPIDPAASDFWQQVALKEKELAEIAARAVVSAPAPTATPVQAEPGKLAPPASALALGGSQTVKTTMRALSESEHYLRYAAGRGLSNGSFEKPASFQTVPQAHRPAFFTTRFGGEEFLLLLDTSGKNGVLYVDLNHDGNLANDGSFRSPNKYDGSGDYQILEFGPIELKDRVKVGKPAPAFTVVARGNATGPRPHYLHVCSDRLYAGDVKFEGRTFKFAILDGDCDGVPTATFKPSTGEMPYYDVIAIDLDQNGGFDQRGEIYPLTAMLGAFGKFYSVQCDPDWGVRVAGASPATGTLTSGCPFLELTLVSQSCAVHLPANDKGSWAVPAGQYAVSDFQLYSGAGSKACLGGSQLGQRMNTVHVADGQTEKIKAGTPLKVEYALDRSSREKEVVHVALRVSGVGGEYYDSGVRAGSQSGQRRPEPKFKIIDAVGKKLAEGKFEYG